MKTPLLLLGILAFSTALRGVEHAAEGASNWALAYGVSTGLCLGVMLMVFLATKQGSRHAA